MSYAIIRTLNTKERAKKEYIDTTKEKIRTIKM